MASLSLSEVALAIVGLLLVASAAHGTNTIQHQTEETAPCVATQTPCPTARP